MENVRLARGLEWFRVSFINSRECLKPVSVSKVYVGGGGKMEDKNLTTDDFGTYWREFPAWALVLYAKTPRGERSLRRGH